jgi:hypothetical protein
MKRTHTRDRDLGCTTQTALRPQLPSVYYPRPQIPKRVVLATPAFREPKARRKDATITLLVLQMTPLMQI